VANRPPPIDT